MTVVEWLKVVLIGIVEGITEWLPISSTGHMILVETFLPFEAAEIFTDDFLEMFNVVIQFGAILAVVTIYFKRLNPWSRSKGPAQRKNTFRLWGKVLVGCIPAAVAGVLLDDWMNEHFYNAAVIAAMLIIYGIAFIVIETLHRNKKSPIQHFSQMSYRTVIAIGLFQVLSLIPGTSRSGATILGGMIFGCSRTVAAEFTFYMAIPIMFGASGLKLVKYGLNFSMLQLSVLLVAMLIAYVVSILSIRFLMGYIKKHDFKVFGWYRIVLGVIVLVALTFL